MLAEASLRSVRDRMLVLRSMSNLRRVDDDSLRWLAEHSTVRRFEAGAVLTREEETLTEVYLLSQGRVQSRIGSRTRELARGQGVGMLLLLAGEDHGEEAVAVEPVVALAVPAAALVGTYQDNTAFVRGALRGIARAVVEARGGLPSVASEGHETPIGARQERPLTLVERILLLREGGAFQAVNTDALIELARWQTQIEGEAGTVLWSIGDPPTHSLRVLYGHIECRAENGESVVIGSDFVLGAMDSLSDLPRHYSATALTDFQSLRMDRDPMFAVLESHPRIGVELLSLLARTLITIG